MTGQKSTKTGQMGLHLPVLSSEHRLESVEHAHSHSGRETRIASIVVARLFWSQFRLLLYALGRELCSLGHRIQILRRKKLAHSGLNLGPVFEKDANGHHRVCIRTHACSEDMQRLQGEHPWLSLTDLEVCRMAWERGFESRAARARSYDSCIRELQS